VALQGTVESFPVIEVVRLLADGGHTGRLSVDGDRGAAVLWVSDGRLLGGELGGTPQFDPVRLVTETLRNRTGEFSFDVVLPGPEAGDGMAAAPLSTVLADAEDQLAEWAGIEQVIPTTAHRLRLSSALPVESVTLDRQQWALVVSAAHLPEVWESATELGMDELTACRLATQMVEMGLLVVEDPAGSAPTGTVDPVDAFLADLPYDEPSSPSPAAPETAPWPEPGPDVLPVADLDLDGDVHVLATDGSSERQVEDPFAGHFPIDDLIGSGPDDDWGDMAEPAPPVAPDPFAGPAAELGGLDDVVPAPAPEPLPSGPVFAGLPELDRSDHQAAPGRARLGSGPVDEAELQRQMADLSPRAAEAIAAALESLPDDPAV
jgi:hypothetical protein